MRVPTTNESVLIANGLARIAFDPDREQIRLRAETNPPALLVVLSLLL
jgi:hypothetical protein